jgi:hypothetical protein
MFQGDYRTGTKASTFEFDRALSPQQPQDIPRDGVCENIRAGNPAARRVNTNLVGIRPKLEPAKVSFVKHQRQWHENHQPDKHHHQARMAI